MTRDLYFNRSLDQGTSWLSTDVRINVGSAPGVGSTRVPQIAAAGSSVYLTWEDRRNGSPDIFFNVASGHQPYGTAKPGAGGVVPTISASGNPAIGGDFTIELENGRGGASGLLLYGFSGAASAIAGAKAAKRIAKWDRAWSPLGSGASAMVHAFGWDGPP